MNFKSPSMKNILFLALLLLVANASATDTTYFAVLRNSLALADHEYSVATYQNLANTCDRIIAIRENEWLPHYYRAYAYAFLGYMTKDEEEKDRMLDRAQVSADAAFSMNPGESEIQLLFALICYGRMEINSMIRAATYFPKSDAALERARELNAKNPRIYYLEGKSTLNKPEFMGGGAATALPILEKALQCYKEFKATFDIYPHWGEEESIRLYEECKGRIAQE